MEYNITSVLFYSFALLASILFAVLANLKEFRKNRRLFIFLSFFTIFLFCGFRFFVGNDYLGYFLNFKYIQKYNLEFGEHLWEPGFFLLAKLFRYLENGYFYLLLVSSGLTLIFLFKTLLFEKCLSWGLFFSFSLGLIFMINDQVRQGIALSIFLFSLRYVKNEQFLKYLIGIVFATLFHYTAILLIFIYFFRDFRGNTWFWVSAIILTYLGSVTGIFYKFLFSLIELIPYYGELYTDKSRFFNIDNSGSGLGILFRVLFALIIAFYFKKMNKPFYAVLFLIGNLIANVSVGFMPIERLSYYLVFTNILIFPELVKTIKRRHISYAIAIASLLFFELQVYYGMEKHGAVPYQTIYNQNLIYPLSK